LNAPESFKEIVNVPRGLILVTGPTGSGKSTTLAAMVDYLNETEYAHILTIEDPIEFVHTSKKCLVNQREVHRDTLGFSEAFARRCVRTRTSSWWVRCATSRPFVWH
jgi:twitching motility protein PilT